VVTLTYVKHIARITYNLLPLAIPAIIYLAIRHYEDAYLFPAEGVVIDFQLFHQARMVPVLLSFCIIPISIIFSIVWLLHSEDAWQRNVRIVLVFALIPLNGLACWSTFGLVLRGLNILLVPRSEATSITSTRSGKLA
ncbi:MAG: hypothetical protein K8J31_28725, partial [Anaerolineae bacterium]|nr:hypothetical protein [Anaerolineae bacterium]